MARQDNLNQVFTDEVTRLKTQIETAYEAVNAIDRALVQVLERLGPQAPELAKALKEYRKAMADLRRQGLRGGPEATKIPCPKCGAVLRSDGNPGDRCDWCGYQFPLTCPSCSQEIKDVAGEPGDRCPFCQYEFR